MKWRTSKERFFEICVKEISKHKDMNFKKGLFLLDLSCGAIEYIFGKDTPSDKEIEFDSNILHDAYITVAIDELNMVFITAKRIWGEDDANADS